MLPNEQIFAKIDELVAFGGAEPKSCEILMQGGLNPRLKLGYYEELLSEIRDRYPMVQLHCLSATEIIYIAHISRLSLEETIARLRAAGLDSIPGAGAEILDDGVRDVIGFRKDRSDEWLEVHRIAHGLGMRTTATMMYGHVETVEHRVEHLERIRDLQDETGGFTAFIAWSFQPDETALGADPGRWDGVKATGFDHLRTVAVARLFLDNVDSLQASWVTQGPKIAQVSLRYGVNDFGSTMLEENVVSAAGTSPHQRDGPAGHGAADPRRRVPAAAARHPLRARRHPRGAAGCGCRGGAGPRGFMSRRSPAAPGIPPGISRWARGCCYCRAPGAPRRHPAAAAP